MTITWTKQQAQELAKHISQEFSRHYIELLPLIPQLVKECGNDKQNTQIIINAASQAIAEEIRGAATYQRIDHRQIESVVLLLQHVIDSKQPELLAAVPEKYIGELMSGEAGHVSDRHSLALFRMVIESKQPRLLATVPANIVDKSMKSAVEFEDTKKVLELFDLVIESEQPELLPQRGLLKSAGDAFRTSMIDYFLHEEIDEMPVVFQEVVKSKYHQLRSLAIHTFALIITITEPKKVLKLLEYAINSQEPELLAVVQADHIIKTMHKAVINASKGLETSTTANLFKLMINSPQPELQTAAPRAVTEIISEAAGYSQFKTVYRLLQHVIDSKRPELLAALPTQAITRTIKAAATEQYIHVVVDISKQAVDSGSPELLAALPETIKTALDSVDPDKNMGIIPVRASNLRELQKLLLNLDIPSLTAAVEDWRKNAKPSLAVTAIQQLLADKKSRGA